jgi:predicted nucleotidyltransferase
VYVFGSYAWGYADDKSDYDVRVDQPLPSNKHIGNIISERLKKQVHIQYLPKLFKESPLIP